MSPPMWEEATFPWSWVFFFGKRGAEQSMGLLGARMYPPGGKRGTRVIPPHKEPEEEAGRGWRDGGEHTHARP